LVEIANLAVVISQGTPIQNVRWSVSKRKKIHPKSCFLDRGHHHPMTHIEETIILIRTLLVGDLETTQRSKKTFGSDKATHRRNKSRFAI